MLECFIISHQSAGFFPPIKTGERGAARTQKQENRLANTACFCFLADRDSDEGTEGRDAGAKERRGRAGGVDEPEAREGGG